MLQADRYEYEHIERICPKVAACTCLYFCERFRPAYHQLYDVAVLQDRHYQTQIHSLQIMNPGAHSRIVCSERMIKVTLANFAPLQSGVIKK